MKKTIFLVDMNAFFISCEMTRNPDLVGQPAAVAGDPHRRTGIILTANYEARKFGVRTAMTVQKALKLCPNIILVPPDHRFYRQKSHEVMDLLYNYTPLVEKNSIDEAWLDMTGIEHLFGKPVEAAEKIMEDIKTNLGLWCSIGISENKFLSKMASDMKKPLGITELWAKDIKQKLWPLPVKKMHGVGEKTANKLSSLGIETIGDLAEYDQIYLTKLLGKHGYELFQKANGIASSTIKNNSPEDVKSIGRSTTLPEDTSDIEELAPILLKFAEDIGMTARKYDKKGHTVQITLKFPDFKTITRQKTIPSTCFTEDIYRIGLELLRENLPPNKAVRLIGITLSGFEEAYPLQQLSIFDLANRPMDHLAGNDKSPNNNNENKKRKVDYVMDHIRNKYGFEKISRAATIKE